MYLGLGIDHDSGVVVTNKSGKVLWAASEERFSRTKNHIGFPHLALRIAMRDLKSELLLDPITNVIFGTYGKLSLGRLKNIINCIEPQPFPFYGFGKNTDFQGLWETPGSKYIEKFRNLELDSKTLKSDAREYLTKYLMDNFQINADVSLMVHHDSHSASAFFSSGFKRALVVTMDGQGDGESITIRLANRQSTPIFKDYVRSSAENSFGHIYSAVTNLYGLKTNRHEGKILGLVASGSPSDTITKINSIVTVENGIPRVQLPFNSLVTHNSNYRDLRHTDLLELYVQTLEVKNYADLAYAVQAVIEEKVINLIKHWMYKLEVTDVALAGGLFANVKLNQVIAESIYPGKVYIYPNMGDGGLPAGAIWDWMQSTGQEVDPDPHPSMLSGPYSLDSPSDLEAFDSLYLLSRFEVEDETSKKYCDVIAQLISEGFFCGLLNGRMEFGPRALGARSILADPRTKVVNEKLNNRLKRSEYMPFAPVCLAEDFNSIFNIDLHGSLKPFKYMTMLCKVNEEWADKIPAVVHSDGTARPQIVKREDYEMLHKILTSFKSITGIPCLVNTSFNLHEEPIVSSLGDGLKALKAGGVDFIGLYPFFYTNPENRELNSRLAQLCSG